MSLLPKPIAIGVSPNTEHDDVFLALRLLFTPWQWFTGDSTKKVKNWFSNEFETPFVSTSNSGRSSLLLLLESFGIGEGDEVIVQAFTCVAVPNSVRWAKATPIFVDIDDTYNIDVTKLEEKITKKTKAIIVQHTFGIPANIEVIQKIAKKHTVLVIEDCAHSLGVQLKGTLLGSFGDAAFFSFGRDKILSSVFGGAAIISKNQSAAGKKLQELEDKLPTSRWWWVFQQLFHPVAFSFILPVYATKLGKALVFFFQKLGFLSFPVYPMEKQGMQPSDFPAKYPEALAALAVHQLSKLDRFSEERIKTVAFYLAAFPEMKNSISKSVPLLRFPISVSEPKSIVLKARARGIYLGNWYQSAVDPKGVVFKTISYFVGSCPNAEEKARHVLNLPTRISKESAEFVVTIVKEATSL
jgi:perosamine synthetase